MQNTQAKDDALAALDGDFGTMFGFDDDLTEEEKFIGHSFSGKYLDLEQ